MRRSIKCHLKNFSTLWLLKGLWNSNGWMKHHPPYRYSKIWCFGETECCLTHWSKIYRTCPQWLRPGDQRKIYISFILLKPIILVNKDDKQHVCTSVSTCKQWFDFPTMNPLSNCLRSNLLCRMEEAEPAQHFNACHRAGLDVHCFIVPFMQLFPLLWLSTHFMYSRRCCTTNYFYHGLILRWLPDNNHNAVLCVGREGESQSFQENKKWKEKHHVKGLERRQSRC